VRLLGVELRRLLARAAIIGIALIGLAGTLLLGLAAYSTAQPMTDQQIAEAEGYYEQERQNWESNGEQMVADCLQQQEQEAELTGEEVDWGCDQMEPQREWYLWEPPTFADFVTTSLPPALMILCLVSLLVGVTFVAAEFAAGSIGTWLTFVPRRGPVFASKTASAAVAGLAFGLLWSGAFLGATAAGYALAGSDVTITSPLIHSMLKVAVLGVAITVVGTGLAFVLRHTAAALGVALGYLIAIDTMVLQNLGAGGWTLVNNIGAWVTGSAVYYDEQCTVDETGTTCEYLEHTITQTQGGLVLLGLVVVVTVIAFATFRRRDV
jgi:ABC-2 type transport system permease protein